MYSSVRQIATFMDSVRAARTLKELARMHRWIEEGDYPSPLSVRQMLARHGASAVKVPLLFYNTYLMPGLTIPIPIPSTGTVNLGNAPALEIRASEIGTLLQDEGIRRNGIIAMLCEVWRDDERDRILDNMSSRPFWAQGSDAGKLTDLQHVGSGLLTISVGYRITRTQKYIFRERGSKTSDADYFANKGVLLTEIDLGLSSYGKIEIYSTHLFNGGFNNTPSDEERIIRQLKQVDELVEFVKMTHLPFNVAMIVGDFNIPEISETNGSDGYNELLKKLYQLDMVDLWKARNGTKGYTNDLGKKRICELDNDEQHCNDYSNYSDEDSNGSFAHFFVTD